MSAPATAAAISWWLSCAASSPSSGLPPVPAGRALGAGCLMGRRVQLLWGAIMVHVKAPA